MSVEEGGGLRQGECVFGASQLFIPRGEIAYIYHVVILCI